ncbi:MAG: hypothetical protein ABI895_24260 [Deltaproteobacteria bacterium]
MKKQTTDMDELVGADDGGSEHARQLAQGDGFEQVGGVRPVGLQSLFGDVEAEAAELPTLAIDG